MKPDYLIRVRWIALVMSLCFGAVHAENWPHWRGPANNGISPETAVPVQWSKSQNVKWRLPLPGPAPSTPVVWGSHIFLTSEDAGNSVLMAVSTDGERLWKRRVGANNRDIRQGESNDTAPSPTTDGSHVWAFLGTGELACFDFAGNEIWKSNLQEHYGKFSTYWGMATSPLLDGDRLYMQLLHSKAQVVVALDKMTGREIWKHTRKTDARSESLHSYASPVMYRHNGLVQLLTHGADYIVAHDPETGAEIWRCGGLQTPGNYNDFFRLVASPVVAPGLIVVPSAKNGPVLGVNPHGAKGDITHRPDQYRWKRSDNTTDVPSPVVHDGLVYICRENGVLLCLDAATGEEIYQESVYRKRHRSSPVISGDKMYLGAYDGTVSVIKTGREYQLLAQNHLDERLSASPVIVNGTLYLRTAEALYAIGGGE